jgi:hypothetical protein
MGNLLSTMTGWQIAKTPLNLHCPMASRLQARLPFMPSRAFYCGFRVDAGHLSRFDALAAYFNADHVQVRD